MTKHRVLHLITKRTIPDFLNNFASEQSIVLTGDAVYLLYDLPRTWSKNRLYAIQEDVLARGATYFENQKIEHAIFLLEYSELPALIEEHDKVCTW